MSCLGTSTGVTDHGREEIVGTVNGMFPTEASTGSQTMDDTMWAADVRDTTGKM
jgi:hypothetical protein